VAAQITDGFWACAQVPFLQQNAVAQNKALLEQAGFVETSPGFFLHPDTSWIRQAGNAYERGAGTTPFLRVPQGLARMGRTAPNFGDVLLAIGDPKIAALTAADLKRSDQGLLDAGFVKKQANLWAHPDSSYVAIAAGEVVFGAQNRVFPAPPSIDAVAASMARTVPNFGDALLAIGDPKIAALTVADLKLSDQGLLDAGFVKKQANLWAHPDSSFVAIGVNTVLFGAQNRVFSAAPNIDALAASLQQAAPDMAVLTRWAKLWSVAFADAKQCKTDLLANGFAELRPGLFKEATGLWVSIKDDKVTCGDETRAFTAFPTPMHLQQKTAGEEHGWTALARAHLLTAHDDPNLANCLSGLGFQQTAPGLWTHQDASWFAICGGKLHRGIGNTCFSDIPHPPDPSKIKQWDTLPSREWKWWIDNTALGHVPLLGNYNQGIGALQGLGFAKMSNNNGVERWQHADGSWVEFIFNGPIRLGWQKWPLGQLPYNNRIAG
jgi:hypothetical protein